MPTVNGQQFPYDEQGLVEAAQAESRGAAQDPKAQMLAGAQAKKQGQQPQGQQPQQGGDDGSAKFNEIMDQAQQLLYSDEISKALIELGNTSKDKARGFADMITHAVIQIDEKNNGELPEDMILPLTEKVVDMLAEIVAEGTGKPLPEEGIMKASSMAIGQLLDHYGVDEQALEGSLKQYDGEEMNAQINRISAGFGGKAVVK